MVLTLLYFFLISNVSKYVVQTTHQVKYWKLSIYNLCISIVTRITNRLQREGEVYNTRWGCTVLDGGYMKNITRVQVATNQWRCTLRAEKKLSLHDST
jgi:hypothetical protein